MNQTLLIGRVVEVPETKETKSGKTVANLVVAVPRDYQNNEGVYETDFFDCTAWNQKANKAADYFKVGDLVLVEAKLQTNSYEKNGEKIRNIDINIKDVRFLSHSKKEIQKELLQDNDEPEMDV